MFDLFRSRAEAVSAEVYRVRGREAAIEQVVAVLVREGVGDEPGARAVWCEGNILAGVDRGAICARIPGLSFDVTRALAAGSRAGVSEFDWAIADTGTIAQDATDVRLRLVSMLPEVHVAVVRTASLLPDFAALLGRVEPRRMRYLACVTGPSRTADIERVLTIGVHGPRRLVIVAVEMSEVRS